VELKKLHGRYVTHGVSNATGVFAFDADGALIKDVDGNVFLDFAAGIGVANAGHCPSEVTAAIADQAGKFIHTSINVVLYEQYARVCEQLCELAPIADAQCMLVNSGAEAVENAVKIARRYTGRSGVATIDGSFHGRTLLTLAMTTKVKPYKYGFGPYPSDVYRLPSPNPYRNDTTLDADEYAVHQADTFGKMLETSISPDALACVVVEPVQGEGGFIPMPKAYLRRLKEICEKHGILFIVDEIQSGIARTGTVFAIEQFGIEPDLMTTSKSLAAGLPLSAVVGKRDVMECIQTGGVGGTFAGNPVACAAALAVLDNVEKHDLCGKARKLGAFIMARCEEMMTEHECIGDVRGLGAMIGMEFVKDREGKAPNKEIVNRVTATALQKGVIFINAGVTSNVIRFLPPLVMTDEQLEFGMDVLDASLK
jgi:4-aminobutyrate aminotransferase/(S)-3-amino-2-methylpropionate transaminase